MLIRSKVIENEIAQKITTNEEMFYELWEIGLNRLLAVVDKGKIIVNNVYWADQLNNGELISTKKNVEQSNKMLGRLYEIFSKYIDHRNFVNYPADIFVGDENHKWGRSPYHYTDCVYEYLLGYLRKKANS